MGSSPGAKMREIIIPLISSLQCFGNFARLPPPLRPYSTRLRETVLSAVGVCALISPGVIAPRARRPMPSLRFRGREGRVLPNAWPVDGEQEKPAPQTQLCALSEARPWEGGSPFVPRGGAPGSFSAFPSLFEPPLQGQLGLYLN